MVRQGNGLTSEERMVQLERGYGTTWEEGMVQWENGTTSEERIVWLRKRIWCSRRGRNDAIGEDGMMWLVRREWCNEEIVLLMKKEWCNKGMVWLEMREWYDWGWGNYRTWEKGMVWFRRRECCNRWRRNDVIGREGIMRRGLGTIRDEEVVQLETREWYNYGRRNGTIR